MTYNLGKLKKISNLREVWNHEALDFTKWLAMLENINLLSEELGIDIRVLETEAGTGRYSVDILAEEENTGKTIIIENQLEMTNHDHLGKVIVYASGHDADIQIWIVKDVRDEHRQAVDWLNEHSDDHVNIFLVQVELWQIGESQIAPKFQVVSKPNNWAKAIKKSVNNNMSNANTLQLNFWEEFKNYCETQGCNFSLRKPRPQHWYSISIGSSECHINLTYSTLKREIACSLWIPDNKELYHKFEQNKENINEKISNHLEWFPKEDNKASEIKQICEIDVDPEGTNWNDVFYWMKNQAEQFKDVFSKYIK